MVSINQELLKVLSELLVEFSEECKKESTKAAELTAEFNKMIKENKPESKKHDHEEVGNFWMTSEQLFATKGKIVAYTQMMERITTILAEAMSGKTKAE
jgi:hypothetical protein